MVVVSVLVLAAALGTSCSKKRAVPAVAPSEAEPGGGATTGLSPFPDFQRPAGNIPTAARSDFFAGKALAEQPWVKAPTVTTARDGLGPLYNARTCLDCHHKGGRGRLPDDERSALKSAFVRLSIPGRDEQHGAVAEPTYGLQFQTQSTSLRHQLRSHLAAQGGVLETLEGGLPPEGQAFVRWQEHPFDYPDGRRVTLRRPLLRLEELGYGDLHPGTLLSLRVAPPMFGAGLIEQIPQSAIDALADPGDSNDDGISGSVNRVWDYGKKRHGPGRFGYKANRATLEITVAGAFAGDIGITNPLFTEQPCTDAQSQCRAQPHGADESGVELSQDLLQLVVNFNRNLGVPRRRRPDATDVLSGRRVFFELGCADCHHPRFLTEASETHPHLGSEVVWPYSDFLLHDMGEGLSDQRPDYEASGQEWRTTPLWGVGLTRAVAGVENYLHDGRARSLEEAILWHGGEADAARQRFSRLDLAERERLLLFLRSL